MREAGLGPTAMAPAPSPSPCARLAQASILRFCGAFSALACRPLPAWGGVRAREISLGDHLIAIAGIPSNLRRRSRAMVAIAVAAALELITSDLWLCFP
uniref:Uncharacterized protein n=1 Tax=Oryza brachyantha TaxID=4533 RepID=J3KWE4_ORYBR